MLVASLATAVALFGLVSVQSLVGQTQIRQTEIARRIEQKMDRMEALHVEVAKLSSLDRVLLRAGQLGMVAPPSIAFLPAPDAGVEPAEFGSKSVPSFIAPTESPTPASSQTPRTKASSAPAPRPSASPAPARGGR